MKKYIMALLLAFSLTGCRSMNEMRQDAYDMGQDVNDKMDNYGQDTYDNTGDFGQDANDNMNGFDDGMNDYDQNTNDGTHDNTNNSDSKNTYGLALRELWTVPSFCNATIGTTLFRGY